MVRKKALSRHVKVLRLKTMDLAVKVLRGKTLDLTHESKKERRHWFLYVDDRRMKALDKAHKSAKNIST